MNFAPDKYEVYYAADKSYGIIYDSVNKAFYKIPALQAKKCKKIKEAYNRNIRISSKKNDNGFLDFHKIRKIELIMTNACNLNCTYCFAHGGSYHKKIRKISKEVLNEIINLINNNDVQEIVFFGGEPTLAEEEIDYFCRLLNMNNLTPQLKMVTNLYEVSEKLIKLIKKNNIILTVSIDGPEEINNINRIARDNGNVFESVSNNIKILNSYGVKIDTIEATITKQHKEKGYTKEFIKEYIKDNFNVRNVYVEEDVNGEEYMSQLKKEQNTYDGFENKNLEWEEKHLLLSYFSKKERNYGFCGAGKRSICVDTQGNIYPCHFYMLEGEKYFLGNILKSKINKFELIDENRNKLNCDNCDAKWICNTCSYLFLNHPLPIDYLCQSIRNMNLRIVYKLTDGKSAD